MQKGNTSSKKTIAPSSAALDNYKSENSKATGGKGKEGMAAINMKDFKCEIDHEIAKCLDTLDRQGLKFLRETLRASKIFGLDTQELGITPPVEQHIENDEQSPPKPHKQKEVVKKIQPKSNNTHSKKGTKVESSKKGPTGAKPTRAGEARGDLNEKITKRLEGLNIKTGKKSEPKPGNKKEKPAQRQKIEVNSIEIAEEIEVEEADSQLENVAKQQPVKSNSEIAPERQAAVNPAFYESSKSWSKREGASKELSREKGEQNPLKPFCKKQFKKHHEEKRHDHRDYGIQISKPEEFRREINDKTEQKSIIAEQQPVFMKELPEEIVKEDIAEQGQIKQLPLSTPTVKGKRQQKQQKQLDPNLINLISKIGRLSPSKQNKLMQIIEKLENSEKYDVTESYVSNNPKNQAISYQKPYIAQRQSFAKNSEVRENNSKSRSKLEKVEKATSLKNSLIKRTPGNSYLTPENRGNLTPTMKKKQVEGGLAAEDKLQSQRQTNNILEMYEDAKSQIISQNRQEQNLTPATLAPTPVLATEQKQQKSKEMQSSANLSASYHSQLNNDSGQKLIKISKKKNEKTAILFKILSNNGHSSLVGLTAIQIFNPQAEIIAIDEGNLRQPSPKLLKLFTSNLKGEGWFTSLSNATISLDSITQTVAGIRIVNWNKSELEADRQADLVEIWVNDQLHWRGQVKGGSYKESEVYATNIKVAQRHFDFPPLPASSISEDKISVKNQSIKSVQLVEEEEAKEACWLEKETVKRQLRQLEEEERKDEKVKKIASVRSTLANKSTGEPKPFEFNWLNENKQKGWEGRQEPEVKPVLKSQHNDDILGELSKGMDNRRREESSVSITKKKEISGSITKKEEAPSKAKEESASKKQQEYLLQKQKQQDEQFEKILQSMEMRSKPQELPSKAKSPTIKEVEQPSEVAQNKGKIMAKKDLQDFMKDSLFDEKPVARKFESKSRPQVGSQERKPELNTHSKKGLNANELDNLIDELNDVVGETEETGEEFCIPQLPVGKELSLTLLSNWGNQAFIGLNGLELFDSEGEVLRPIGVSCNCMSSKQLYEKLFKQELLTSDEKMQVRFPKGKRIAISLTLPERTELAAVRIWNYNGHRVHNNIGVKKLHMRLDGCFIFSGEVGQSSGASEDAYKYCQYVLFTDSSSILKRISDNDWLSSITRNEEEERAMFRTTLEHFHRPLTRNDEEAVKQQEMEVQRQPVKIPKRQCSEYDPPLLPEGFVIKLVLHSSWGDRFFIGLNAIEVFNDRGESITTKNLLQIRADPSSISKLPGYEKDKRVVGNLISGKHSSAVEGSSWLAPLLSDVEKIEKGRPNVVLLEFGKPNKISGINFYNYSKTPERGVRELEVFLDNCLLYRGYLRKHGAESGLSHTTINFTKEQSLLEAMNYAGYNEDHLQQEVGLVNEQKLIRAGTVAVEQNLVRPMTGKLLN